MSIRTTLIILLVAIVSVCGLLSVPVWTNILNAILNYVVLPAVILLGTLFGMEAGFEALFPKRGGRGGKLGAGARKGGNGRLRY